LITNKPAVSSSLPHALLQGNRSLTVNTPTLLRRGLSVEVIRDCANIDKAKMTRLLEQSFGRVLDSDAFYARLEKDLDFVIITGDYAGAAIVTKGVVQHRSFCSPDRLPRQVCCPPEPPGRWHGRLSLGRPPRRNVRSWLTLFRQSERRKGGQGEGKDLVWRSRSNNPINKWYFERSSGHLRMGDWVLFWCDAERRLKTEEGRRASAGLSYVEEWEHGRLGCGQTSSPRCPRVGKSNTNRI
jgi:amino-acid N-acetyltransferase